MALGLWAFAQGRVTYSAFEITLEERAGLLRL